MSSIGDGGEREVEFESAEVLSHQSGILVEESGQVRELVLNPRREYWA